MADPPTLGSRLGAIREDQGLSLKEAATFTRLTTSYLWYVEQDSVGESFLLQITNAYRVDPHSYSNCAKKSATPTRSEPAAEP